MERAVSAASDANDAPTQVQTPHAHVPPTAKAHSPEDHVPSSTPKTYFAQPMQKHETYQVFRMPTSTSAEARNADLSQRGSATPTTVIPPSFGKYYRRNHPLGRLTYANHTSNRRVDDADRQSHSRRTKCAGSLRLSRR
ncbi:hypothetical protein JG688_00006785 [Phytophthora aleatoria]|uniref:Uncharacterized protein n=1 Tax=Phytophthora aleatoria TaxID=2496075 RepID=A0A8J5M8L9_9STRA|nr:hypothetical protein JG688_00006785 [Phytophthora aleatoria]